MSALRNVARDWLPPALVRWLRRVRGEGACFEGNFGTWEEARAQCTGYNAEEILAKVLAATLKVKRGEAVFDRDSVVFDKAEYRWPVLSGLMWAAAMGGGRLNVLDFGGALGSSYFQYRQFLQPLCEVRWSIVEQLHYVEAGRKHVHEEQLRFYGTIEECMAENRPNVILLSSVMQYLESPMEIIGKLHTLGAHCLIIDRTPFSASEGDRLAIQKVPASIYEASYPMWIFSLSKFEHALEADWNLVDISLGPEGNARTASGFEFSFQGMLLESRR